MRFIFFSLIMNLVALFWIFFISIFSERERDAIARPSVCLFACRLSSVTLVHPTQYSGG